MSSLYSNSSEFFKVKIFRNALIATVVLLPAFTSFGQETQEKVVDEVVAQVNNDVITLSRVKKEIEQIINSEVQQGKSRDSVVKAVNEKQGELIASMINEELMVQRAKELGIDKEADVEVNGRFAQIMKQYNLKTLESLYKAMEEQGVNPQDMREMWRKQAIREILVQRELQAKVYWEPTAKDVKDYFEKNKTKFTKPEMFTLSEIFLSFAGRDEAAVREKAKQLAAKARTGVDFAQLAIENSERKDVATTKGKIDPIEMKQIEQADPKIAAAVKPLKKGDVTDPIDSEDIGVVIFKIDDRTAASTESFFDERNVRLAMLSERMPGRQKEFMAKLRENAYIKINETYRPLVSPILFAQERKEKTAN